MADGAGQPAFRASQLYAGVYGHFASRAAAIPGVPKALGAQIDAALPSTSLRK